MLRGLIHRAAFSTPSNMPFHNRRDYAEPRAHGEQKRSSTTDNATKDAKSNGHITGPPLRRRWSMALERHSYSHHHTRTRQRQNVFKEGRALPGRLIEQIRAPDVEAVSGRPKPKRVIHARVKEGVSRRCCLKGRHAILRYGMHQFYACSQLLALIGKRKSVAQWGHIGQRRVVREVLRVNVVRLGFQVEIVRIRYLAIPFTGDDTFHALVGRGGDPGDVAGEKMDVNDAFSPTKFACLVVGKDLKAVDKRARWRGFNVAKEVVVEGAEASGDKTGFLTNANVNTKCSFQAEIGIADQEKLKRRVMRTARIQLRGCWRALRIAQGQRRIAVLCEVINDAGGHTNRNEVALLLA